MAASIKSKTGYIIMAAIVLFVLWQGSIFAVQYILMVILLLSSLALSKQPLKITLNVFLLSGMAVIMLLSLIFLAGSFHSALLEWLRYLLWPLLLLFCLNHDAKQMETGIYMACLAVALIGLLAYAGMVSLPYAIVAESGRLQSTIQYANTTALLMIVGIIYAVHSWLEGRRWQHLLMAALFTVTLLLTGSRSSFLILAFLALLFIFMQLKKKQRLIAAAGIVLLIIAVFASNLRIGMIYLSSPTLMERLITYQDALHILKNSLIAGIGIGNWNWQQYIHQSAPYSVRYIHNYYLQVWLDGGLLALVLFLTVLVSGLVHAWKKRDRHFYVLLAVAPHIGVDFDMAFAAIVLIFMYSLSQVQDKTFNALEMGRVRHLLWLPVLALIPLWCSEWYYQRSVSYLAEAEYTKAKKACEQSISFNPLNSHAYYNMARSLEDMDAARLYLETAIEKDPHDMDARELLLHFDMAAGNYMAAISGAETLLAARRFSRTYRLLYEEALYLAAMNGLLSETEMAEKIALQDMRTEDVNHLYTQYIEPFVVTAYGH